VVSRIYMTSSTIILSARDTFVGIRDKTAVPDWARKIETFRKHLKLS
jgi:hypothetical protein